MEVAEVETVEVETAGGPGGAGKTGVVRIEAELVVHLTLLLVAENVVGLPDLLEALFSRLVAGVHVGMIFAGQPAVGFPDLVGRSLL